MSKAKWSKVKPGDVVDLRGVEWTVEKVKPGKKKIAVRIRHRGQVAEAKVAGDEKVHVVRSGGAAPRAGKPAKAKPKPEAPTAAPKVPKGSPWETQEDRIERKLDELLGARLIGETPGGGEGWYVPPVDVSTIAMHLMTFHGPTVLDGTEADMLDRHAAEHEKAGADWAGSIPHVHTERRPRKK